ncbi:MAG: N-acetyltransferase family protein, partial [Bacteroidetes bacterium]|nr:N-acetyltransferase family protein [Bacteroidota bacterium]
MIREINVADASQICGIYNYYIENTVITFELEPVDLAEMTRRISEITKVYPWIV